MNGSRASAARLLDGVTTGAPQGVQIAVCPPAIFIPLAAEKLARSNIAWGGQNLSEHASGAFTGEISGTMLRDFGCTYVIVGHSERRSLYGESDDVVAAKYIAAQAAGLVPILCVGESLAEREGGTTEAVVKRQLAAVVQRAGIDSFAKAVIAYEPVWAIGTGRNASPEQAQAVHAFIRADLARASQGIAGQTQILYGGSVKANNAAGLFSQADIDGGLIGGASLTADEFLGICRAAA